MLQSLGNIEKLYRHNRNITIASVIMMTITAIVCVRYTTNVARELSQNVYAVIGENTVRLQAVNERENLPVEARGHVELFHRCFYDLDPDPDAVNAHIDRALLLGDGSVHELHDRYRENSYYSNLIAGNVSQTPTVDSIEIDMSSTPYRFRYTGKLEIVRATSVTTRELVTEGRFRRVARTDANPFGFLIEGYRIVSNDDIRTVRRRL